MNVRIGNGKQVHAIERQNGMYVQTRCIYYGFIGARGDSATLTDDPVTCKRCLKEIQADVDCL